MTLGLAMMDVEQFDRLIVERGFDPEAVIPHWAREEGQTIRQFLREAYDMKLETRLAILRHPAEIEEFHVVLDRYSRYLERVAQNGAA